MHTAGFARAFPRKFGVRKRSADHIFQFGTLGFMDHHQDEDDRNERTRSIDTDTVASIEDVCAAPSITAVIAPDDRLTDHHAALIDTFRALYTHLKSQFQQIG